MGKRKGVYKVLVEKPEGDYLEDLGIDEMLLEWIFKRSVGWFGTALIDEEINNNEYRECLLTFSPDFFVFLFAA